MLKQRETVKAVPPMLRAAGVRLDGVTKRFGDVRAVDDVSLDIPSGTFTTLLGPSGCGKTTLLRMIAGFYDVDGGEIYLGNQRITTMPAHKRRTAMVFQDYALFPHMRVRENVAYGLRLAHEKRDDITRRVGETLDFVGLTGLGERYPGELSGGQQQRVALARALVIEPAVLLLDEPLSNLDAKLREQIRWELRAVQQRLGITFIYVTHDQEEALAASDWIAVMNKGRVEQWGTPREIYERPRTAFLADFVGTVNLLPASVIARDGDTLTVAFAGHRLIVAAPEGAVGDTVTLSVRPESLTIGVTPTASPGLHVTGTVERWAFLGQMARYWVRVGAHELIVNQPDPGSAPTLSGDICLTLRPERVHVIPETA
jgi:ABC-type Fe3+/spermidine/putrescine transport system ATPase subunit